MGMLNLTSLGIVFSFTRVFERLNIVDSLSEMDLAIDLDTYWSNNDKA